MCAVCMGQHETSPEISVLMGLYYQRDSLQLLRRSIRSSLEQSFSNFEFLICDDGSSQMARSCIRTFAEKDPRIRMVERCDLFTLSAKLNACLREAKGPFIARMDDDDYSHPDRFEKQVSYLKENPGINICGSNVELWENGRYIGKQKLPEHPDVKDFLFTQPYIHPSIMFRRSALLTVEGYSEDKRCILCEDYDLLLRLYEKGCQGVNLQECLLDYTVSDTAKSGRKMPARWNEVVTRYRRFRSLNLLPLAWPYVIKPIAVGLLPKKIVQEMKKKRNEKRCRQ